MAEMPRVGDDIGRYRLDEQIGWGGMGVVFGATDRVLGRRVALKVVSASLSDSAEFLQRFHREAALLAKLDSPHVVSIYDYGEQDGCPFLVTQYVPGGDLGALLRARGPMPPDLAATVCAHIAEALADTHRLGVVHRDVKPSNVLLRDPNAVPLTAYLCDFGIARSASDGLTQGGMVSGTWGYLAPEVGRGEPATPASDIYAVGCVLWACLVAHPPYGGTDVEVAIAHQRSPVPQMVGRDAFSLRLNHILARCLAKDPDQRYADAAGLQADLVALAAIGSTGVHPVERDGRRTALPARRGARRATPPRRTGLIAGVVAGVLAMAGATVVAVHPWSNRSVDPAQGTVLPTAGTSPTPSSTIQGDLDGDGFGDIQARIYDANGDHGNGSYLTATWLSTGTRLRGPEVTRAARHGVNLRVARADIDGDGTPENLTCRITTTTMSCQAPLSGGGVLDDQTALPADVQPDVVPLAGDVDGDGRADLIIASYHYNDHAHRYVGSLHVDVAHNTGNDVGTTQPWARLPIPSGTRPELTVADVTGDGKADAVYATLTDRYPATSTATIAVHPSDGVSFAGSGPTARFASRGWFPDSLLVGDVDGDRRPEIFYASQDDDALHFYVVRAGARLARPTLWGSAATAGWSTREPAVGLSDVDGDGKADVVEVGEATTATAKVKVSLSTGRSFGRSRPWGAWRHDLGDAYPDLLDAGQAP